MRFIKFHIRCEQCGHTNMPDNNTRKGITKTLTGEFLKCNGCGTEWRKIQVPCRPLVMKIANVIKEKGPGFHPRVYLFEYEGQVPKAIAI